MNVDAVLTLLVIGGLVFFFYGPWQALCTDMARQLLFEQRDKLFDLALAGQIGFDDPIYRELRTSVERSIRFAHCMTLTRIGYLAWTMRKELRGSSNLRSTVDKITDLDLRQKVGAIVNNTAVIVTCSMFLRSLIFFPLVPELYLISRALMAFDLCRRLVVGYVKSLGDLVQREAEFTS